MAHSRPFRSFPSATTRADSSPSGIVAQAGLVFPSNGQANGNIQLDWSTTVVPRFSHTAIWRYKPVQQTSYYALVWHSRADGTWDAPNARYVFGTHFYPCDGRVNTDGTAVALDVNLHCHEIADGNDVIKTPPASGDVTPFSAWGTWLLQARKCVQVGSDYVHTFWPDIENNPSLSIVWTRPTSDYPSPPSLGFYFGASKWTASGNTNSECPSGTLRSVMLFNEGLSLAEIQAHGARTANLTTAIDARCVYSNISPTPTDVTDKSGAGNNPSWANANRPTLWTP